MKGPVMPDLGSCLFCQKSLSPNSRYAYCDRPWCRVERLKALNVHQERYLADPQGRADIEPGPYSRRISLLGLPEVSTIRQLHAYLMKLDGGICGICTKPVVETSGPMRPSADHIIPMALGGKHSPGNLQLSHLRCNISKGARLSGPNGRLLRVRVTLTGCVTSFRALRVRITGEVTKPVVRITGEVTGVRHRGPIVRLSVLPDGSIVCRPIRYA